MTPRVLITGADGQLGRELVDHLAGRPGLEVVAAGRSHLDITNRAVTLAALEAAAPRWVIHAAAWTAVDACEADPDRAFAVNAYGTRNVAEGARLVGAHLCYLSTDYVFDGLLDRPYTEWDPVAPGSVYGRSKLGGEREVDPGWSVVRTSWLFGYHGGNIVRTVLRLARDAAGTGTRLRFVDDQHGCPTAADDLAPAVADLALSRLPGTFHVTNQGATTWYGLARAVVEEAGLDPDLVDPITSADLDPARYPAPRPANSVLAGVALAAAGRDLLPDWHEPMARLVRRLEKEP